MIQSAVEQIVVDPNDPKAQVVAQQIAVQLVQILGVEMAIAVSVVVVARLLDGVMHMSTPMPEANVQMMEKLLDGLKAVVMSHASCAKRINMSKDKTVH